MTQAKLQATVYVMFAEFVHATLCGLRNSYLPPPSGSPPRDLLQKLEKGNSREACSKNTDWDEIFNFPEDHIRVEVGQEVGASNGQDAGAPPGDAEIPPPDDGTVLRLNFGFAPCLRCVCDATVAPWRNGAMGLGCYSLLI